MTKTYEEDDMSAEAIAWRASVAAEALTGGGAAQGEAGQATGAEGGDGDAALGADTGAQLVAPPDATAQALSLAGAGVTLPAGSARDDGLGVFTVLGFTIPQIISFVGTVASAALPGAAVAGMSVNQLTALALGVANAVPQAVQAFDEIKKIPYRQAPTPEQWARWNAAADAAHAEFGAAAAEVIA